MKKPGIARAHIEATLRKLPFVTWDRYVSFPEGVEVYGWIDRPRDAYKDFVSLFFYPDGDVAFSTSSAKMSLPIHKLLNGGRASGHRRCRRVEGHFRVRNVLRAKR
jgi:hypothetical protein